MLVYSFSSLKLTTLGVRPLLVKEAMKDLPQGVEKGWGAFCLTEGGHHQSMSHWELLLY